MHTFRILGAVGGLLALAAAGAALLAGRDPLPPLLGFGLGLALLIPLLDRAGEIGPAPLERGPLLLIPALIALTQLSIQGGNIPAALMISGTAWALGWAWGGPWAGLCAGAIAAASGWTLALGAVDVQAASLAILGGLYLAGFSRGGRWPSLLAAAALGVGAGLSPTLAALALLLPLDRRRGPRIGLCALLIAAPFWYALQPPLPTPPRPDDPSLGFGEALAAHVLMFNLTTDPNPLHGLAGRPAFAPFPAAALLIGTLALIWRADRMRHAAALFPLAALVAALIPAALLRASPADFPNLLHAAPALPAASAVAGCGLALIARVVVARWGGHGGLIAVAGLTAALTVTALDARAHYLTVVLPLLFAGG